ncbi:MerR family transcriptional regulator [Anaerobacillus alkaliphilus]|uniref:MerR family transcriptional regulator n=1 Tax=Anaerobacillus alkaliphilus TaxID=1548597 RepID=A0A4Q0VXR6_9BACI|nr:MerR family transcriptional regulator [Anaerobacillus alkaliphilus]RXJ04543.1 MerR family transcriptional regulator [Anaerobacillus alkaliphilus]
MEYTVKKLSMLAGISTRTLRYYDEIGLLTPARTNSSGYRIYGQKEVDKLQQILFYKELGLELDKIMDILNDPTFDAIAALKMHQAKLLEKREQLDLLINNVSKTIGANEGRIIMSDKEKFEGFKQKLIDENEEKYGKEIREKYGDETVNQSNAKLQNMTEEDLEKVTLLADQIHTTLAEAMKLGDPTSEVAQKAVDLHKQWLTYYWPTYSKEAHAGLAEMYVADERFKAYYDKEQDGVAELLRDAILIYTGMKN